MSPTVTESSPLLGASSAAIPTTAKDRLDLSKEESIDTSTGPQFHSLSEDVIDTFKLGVPIFIAMLSWVGVSPWILYCLVCVLVESTAFLHSSNFNLIPPYPLRSQTDEDNRYSSIGSC
jgi:hypothetical protein